MSSAKKIGLATAVIVGMNAMIGSGIFTLPALLLSQAGPAGILTTIFCSLTAWFLALSLAKVAEAFPAQGSFYNYTKQWAGHTLGVIVNCSYLIGLCIAMGLLAKVGGIYMQYHFSSVNASTLGFLILTTLVVLNMFGVAISELGQYILICLTVFPLIITSILCFSRANINNLFPFAPHGIQSIFSAAKPVIFAFMGFESAASLFGIVENPSKNVPKALSYSLLIVACIYIMFASSIILAIPASQLADPMARFTTALTQTFPDKTWLITLINISILSAIIGTIHSMIWGASQLLMDFVKLLKNNTARTLIKKNIITPTTSVLIVGACIAISFFTLHNIDLFFSFTDLFIVFAYSASIIGILTLKNKFTSQEKIIAILGLLAATLIIYFAISDIIYLAFSN